MVEKCQEIKKKLILHKKTMTKEEITREKDLIMRRLYGQSLAEIGRDFSLTRERVRQLELEVNRQAGTIIGVHGELIKDLRTILKKFGIRQEKIQPNLLSTKQVISRPDRYSAGYRSKIALRMIELIRLQLKIYQDCLLEVGKKHGITMK